MTRKTKSVNHRNANRMKNKQYKNPKTGKYVEKDSKTGRFVDKKTSNKKPFKKVSK